MELYEAMVVISPEPEQEEHEEVLSGLYATITKNGGSVDTTLDWRKRRLAYEIDKFQEGHYYLVYFKAPGTVIPEIEHYFKVTDEVIRYMVVRTDEQEFEAAAKKVATEAAAAEKAAAAAAEPGPEAGPAEETVAPAEEPAAPAEETAEPVTEDPSAETSALPEESEEPGDQDETETTDRE